MKEKKQESDLENMLKLSAMANSSIDATTSDEAQAKAVNTLADTKDHQTMSDLDPNEIVLLTALKTVAEEFNDPMLKDVVRNLCRFKVSRDRLGRSEIKEIAHNVSESEKSRWEKLRGMLGFK